MRYPEHICVILPGKRYRYEQITARSERQFYQVEGLAVGHAITMTDLIGTLTEFARRFYGPDRRIRIRGSYFPFTEPSIEADMDCILGGGDGVSGGAGKQRLRPRRVERLRFWLRRRAASHGQIQH